MEDIARMNPDLYVEFCKTKLKSIPEDKYKQLLRPFIETDYSSTMEGVDRHGIRSVPGIDTFIAHLYSSVPSPMERQEAINMGTSAGTPPPLKPGQGYVKYLKDASDNYVGPYGRLLAYASNIMATVAEEIEKHVERAETTLFPVKKQQVQSVRPAWAQFA
ncbi:hypothetical protein BG004_004262 [Podila humilis]|nr:hypothetical protein BG004_004262 [Podila humilis]